MILGSGISNIVIVVTRYFGGTLLGTGGLVRAYSEAAREGIRHCQVMDKIRGIRVRLTGEYTDLGKLQYLLAQNKVHVLDTEYTDKVAVTALFPLEDSEKLQEIITESTSGRVGIEKIEELYYGIVDGKVISV